MKQRPSSERLLQSFADRQRLKTRVDVDGTLFIPGKLGHIYQYDADHLAVLVMPASFRRHYWGVTRGRLAKQGFTIVQDGDCEGAALFAPCDSEQARAAIRAAGILRKRRLSHTQVEKQITWLRASAGRAL